MKYKYPHVTKLTILIAIICAIIIYSSPTYTFSIKDASYRGDNLWIYQIPKPPIYLNLLYKMVPDDNGNNLKSKLILLENDINIGKAHAIHEDIKVTGKGAFSHWDDHLFFSTSDNSNPNTNGFTYKVSIPLQPRSIIWIVGMICLLICIINLIIKITHKNYRQIFGITLHFISIIFFYLGITLLLLNFIGIIYGDYFFYHPDNMGNDFKKTTNLSLFDRKENESVEIYIPRLTSMAKKNIYHYFSDSTKDDNWETISKRLVPITENWIIVAIGFWNYISGNFTQTNIEFLDPLLALRRGYGFCSQYASFIYSILQRNNIPVRYWVLNGHVINEAQLPNKNWWIIDADYEVVIPYSLKDINKYKNTLIEEYQKSIHTTPEMMSSLMSLYSAKFESYWLVTNLEESTSILPTKYVKFSYYAKWLIPILAIMLRYILLYIKNITYFNSLNITDSDNVK